MNLDNGPSACLRSVQLGFVGEAIVSIEVVISRAKAIESLLKQLGFEGKGLHDRTSSAAPYMPSEITRACRKVATIRNKIVHENAYTLSSVALADFISTADFVIDQLQQTVTASSPQATRSSNHAQSGDELSNHHEDEQRLSELDIGPAVRLEESAADIKPTKISGVDYAMGPSIEMREPESERPSQSATQDGAAGQEEKPQYTLKHYLIAGVSSLAIAGVWALNISKYL